MTCDLPDEIMVSSGRLFSCDRKKISSTCPSTRNICIYVPQLWKFSGDFFAIYRHDMKDFMRHYSCFQSYTESLKIKSSCSKNVTPEQSPSRSTWQTYRFPFNKSADNAVLALLRLLTNLLHHHVTHLQS